MQFCNFPMCMAELAPGTRGNRLAWCAGGRRLLPAHANTFSVGATLCCMAVGQPAPCNMPCHAAMHSPSNWVFESFQRVSRADFAVAAALRAAPINPELQGFSPYIFTFFPGHVVTLCMKM